MTESRVLNLFTFMVISQDKCMKISHILWLNLSNLLTETQPFFVAILVIFSRIIPTEIHGFWTYQWL
jgi:hypothetical protein